MSATVLVAGCASLPWGAKSGNGPGLPGATADAKGKPDDKSTVPNRLAMARLCERRSQFADSIRLYQEIAKETPDNPTPHHRLAVIYCRQGKFKEADECFQRALSLKPDDPQVLGDAGYCCHLTNRPLDAERLLRRAIELEPDNRTHCNNLAVVLGNLGRRDESLAMFRRAGSEKYALANHAFMLAQHGEYQQAFDIYDRLLTEDQSMRVAADAMIELSKFVPQKPAKPAAAKPEADSALATVTSREAGTSPRAALPASLIGARQTSTEKATAVAATEEIAAATVPALPTETHRESVSCVFTGPAPMAPSADSPLSAKLSDPLLSPLSSVATVEGSSRANGSFGDRLAMIVLVGLALVGAIVYRGSRRPATIPAADAVPLPQMRPASGHRVIGGLRDALAGISRRRNR